MGLLAEPQNQVDLFRWLGSVLSDHSRETQTARVLNRMGIKFSCIRAKGNS